MKLPKVECEKCGSTHWEYNDNKHECKNCPNEISDTEMLRRINKKLLKKVR